MGVKRKIFFIVLGISLASLVAFCAAAFWGLFSIRAQVRQSSEKLGDFAAANSSRFLEIELHDKLITQAEDQSLIINERLLGIAKDALFFSNFVNDIYKNEQQLSSVSIPYSSTENFGKLTVQLQSANGISDFPQIRREAELLGNIRPVFESNKDDMADMTVAVYLGTESGFLLSYDPYSHDSNQIIDPRTRPWYAGAKDTRGTYWTSPYIGADSGELVITCSYPFYNSNGEFAGVIGIDVLINDLNSEIKNINAGKGGFAFIVDAGGVLISSSISEIHEDFVSAAKKELPPGDRGFKRIMAGETEMYLAFSPVQATGWTFAILQPVSEITEIITENKNAINIMTQDTMEHISAIIRVIIFVFAGIFVIVVIGIAVFSNKMSTKIARPIDVLEAELNVAKKIQASMLPCIFPPFPNHKEFDIYATMQPAKEVGGDFYDFFMVNADTIAVIIADVSGKGVPAALFMVIAKTLIKSNAQSGKKPKDVFIAVNNILCENNDECMFVTAFMGFFDIPSGKFTFVNAGHNPPLLRREGKAYEWLSVEPGFVLAAMEGMQYNQHEITINKGDSLYLYTDGVTEAFNNKKEMFSESRLLETVNKYRDLPIIDFLHKIKNEIDLFAHGAEQADDITMLIFKNNG